MKPNKTVVQALLLIITCAIWGGIIYKIISFTDMGGEGVRNFPDGGSGEIDYGLRVQISGIDSIDITELRISRDPFSMTLPDRRPKRPAPVNVSMKHEEPEPEFQYQLNGLIHNQSARLVILEDLSEGTIHFLREGDVYKYLTIGKVKIDRVTLLERGREKEIIVRY